MNATGQSATDHPATDTRTGTTHVIKIIDRSGSMYAKAGDVRGGFNAYINDLHTSPGRYRVTVVTFADTHHELCADVPPTHVPTLDRDNYLTGGNTALLDAVGSTILKFVTSNPTRTLSGDDRVIVIIHTDGRENASRRWSWDETNDLIDSLHLTGHWEFVFIGAGPEAWKDSDRFAQGTISVETTDTATGTRAAYAAASATTDAYNRGTTGRALGDLAADVIRQYQDPDPAGDVTERTDQNPTTP